MPEGNLGVKASAVGEQVIERARIDGGDAAHQLEGLFPCGAALWWRSVHQPAARVVTRVVGCNDAGDSGHDHIGSAKNAVVRIEPDDFGDGQRAEPMHALHELCLAAKVSVDE